MVSVSGWLGHSLPDSRPAMNLALSHEVWTCFANQRELIGRESSRQQVLDGELALVGICHREAEPGVEVLEGLCELGGRGVEDVHAQEPIATIGFRNSVVQMPEDLDTLASHTISRSMLTPAQVQDEVTALGSRWSIAGEDLKLELRGAPMTQCGAAVAYAASLADEMEHHPSIAVEFGGTTLKIHSHDKNAITVIDLVYAGRLEQWLRAHGW